MSLTVFLDRDGVLNVDSVNYIRSPEEFQWQTGAREAVALLNRHNIPVYIITNQSAVGRGMITRETLEDIHRKLADDLEESGAHVDGIYVCPHAPEAGCTCRKPETGLLLQAEREHNLDLSEAWFIGDSQTDMLAAKRVGSRTILIRSPLKTIDWSNEPLVDFTFDSLKEAVEFLLPLAS